jgi:uncharacterized membrane protein
VAPANIAFAVIVIAYPIIVYFGLDYFEARLVALAVIVIAVVRFFLIKKMEGIAARLPTANFVIGGLILVGLSTLATNSAVLLQFYPVCMNILLFGTFLNSLFRPPSMIEQFARMKTPNLPEAGVAYTRKATMVWCGFFAINGSMALYTALETNIGFWAIYNSLISYSLIGILFAGEYCVRKIVQRRDARNHGKKGWL